MFQFRLHPANVAALQAARFGFVSLANNHCLDYKLRGLLDTQAALNAAGIAWAGVGRAAAAARPAVVERAGLKLAFFSYAGECCGPASSECCPSYLPPSFLLPSTSLRPFDADHYDIWAATEEREGINYIDPEAFSPAAVRRQLAQAQEAGADLTAVFIHWVGKGRVGCRCRGGGAHVPAPLPTSCRELCATLALPPSPPLLLCPAGSKLEVAAVSGHPAAGSRVHRCRWGGGLHQKGRWEEAEGRLRQLCMQLNFGFVHPSPKCMLQGQTLCLGTAATTSRASRCTASGPSSMGQVGRGGAGQCATGQGASSRCGWPAVLLAAQPLQPPCTPQTGFTAPSVALQAPLSTTIAGTKGTGTTCPSSTAATSPRGAPPGWSWCPPASPISSRYSANA